MVNERNVRRVTERDKDTERKREREGERNYVSCPSVQNVVMAFAQFPTMKNK